LTTDLGGTFIVITIDTVKHVAKLARLRLSEKEEILYTEQLGKILEYFDELAAVDTTGIEPMSHPLPLTNVMREDEVEVTLTHDALLKNAPSTEDEFFRVPKIGE
jgi:aspartyl-tRNA(Asn)/glutamyl-tRNA(Gln) amidotransferase subunit C